MDAGTLIEITADRLGVFGSPTVDTDYRPDVFGSYGDRGSYVGPHPLSDMAAKDWHVVELTDADHGTLYAPVHVSHFEVR